MFICSSIKDGEYAWVKLNQSQGLVIVPPSDGNNKKLDITHNLNRYPNVIIIDDLGEEIIGDVTYLNENELCIEFTESFLGKVILN